MSVLKKLGILRKDPIAEDGESTKYLLLVELLIDTLAEGVSVTKKRLDLHPERLLPLFCVILTRLFDSVSVFDRQ